MRFLQENDTRYLKQNIKSSRSFGSSENVQSEVVWAILRNFGISDPLETGDDSQINILQLKKLTQGKSKSKTHASTGSNN